MGSLAKLDLVDGGLITLGLYIVWFSGLDSVWWDAGREVQGNSSKILMHQD